MSYLEKVDRYLDSLKVGKSATVDSWFLMSSPAPMLAIVTAYLLSIRIIPSIMRNREPLKMDKLIRYYNAFQVLYSFFMVVKCFELNLFKDGMIYAGCRYSSATQNLHLLALGWYYFFAKVTELLDTIFFMLRKKNNQVTFLHVYHHGTMALYAWSYLKFAAGGQGAILALLNSAVHIVMYGYYFLSGLGPGIQKYLWWKKYVTSMQLIQFLIMLVYCVWTHYTPRCQYSAGFTYFISTNVTIFLFLFLNFYSKSYKKRPEKEIEKIQKNGITQNGKVQNGKINGLNGYERKENGLSANYNKNLSDVEDSYELKSMVSEGIFLTRRTAKMSFENGDFDTIIKK